MEIEGHPTQDILEELLRRGAVSMAGSAEGPDPEALRVLTEEAEGHTGTWLFLPQGVYRTGFDEMPG